MEQSTFPHKDTIDEYIKLTQRNFSDCVNHIFHNDIVCALNLIHEQHDAINQILHETVKSSYEGIGIKQYNSYNDLSLYDKFVFIHTILFANRYITKHIDDVSNILKMLDATRAHFSLEKVEEQMQLHQEAINNFAVQLMSNYYSNTFNYRSSNHAPELAVSFVLSFLFSSYATTIHLINSYVSKQLNNNLKRHNIHIYLCLFLLNDVCLNQLIDLRYLAKN